MTSTVLRPAGLLTATVMLYYGWPKIRDPRKNATDFDATGGMGYAGRLQFRRCMDPRGYAVTSRD